MLHFVFNGLRSSQSFHVVNDKERGTMRVIFSWCCPYYEDGCSLHNLLFDELSIVETAMSANLSVLFPIQSSHIYKTHCYSVLAVHVVYLTFQHSTMSLVFQLIKNIIHVKEANLHTESSQLERKLSNLHPPDNLHRHHSHQA